MRRSHGSGHLYMKWGAYYVRWRSVEGRRRNRRVGKVRTRGEKDGLTRAGAERESRRIIDAETDQSPVEPATPPPTVDEVVDQLRDKIAIEGARLRTGRTAHPCSGCTSRRPSANNA